MGNSIKPHIQTAEKTGACNLSKHSITEFPGELLRIGKNLRNLDLSQNKLPSIPPAISSFSSLKNLQLSHNRLVSLPDTLGELVRLESLDVSFNQLSCLPASLKNLLALRSLDASHNQISSFPAQLADLSNLDSVNLAQNKLSALPSALGQFHVIELNLNQNQIANLPEEVCSCPRLKVLRMEENCLPLATITPKILKESSISLFAIDGNLFSMKQFNNIDGYEQYMERYTATRRKME